MLIRTGKNFVPTRTRAIKNEAPAWDRGPRRVRFVVSVVFTPTRGVIHPSFPLRGRWERIAKSGEQAPSPSLASLLNSSCETHSCTSLVHGLRQSRRGCDFLSSHLLTNTWLDAAIPHTAPNPSLRPTLELAKTDSGTLPFSVRRFVAPTWFQDPGNKIFGLAALSVFRRNARSMPSCPSFPATTPLSGPWGS